MEWEGSTSFSRSRELRRELFFLEASPRHRECLGRVRCPCCPGPFATLLSFFLGGEVPLRVPLPQPVG